eukprot:EST44929.1 Dynein heavy chain [Spironucleus salmonicida]
MTELIKEYYDACQKANTIPSAQLLQQLDSQLQLNVQESYYPIGSLASELELYQRILLEKQNEGRAQKIIHEINILQGIVLSPLRQSLDTTALEKAGCTRVSQIREAFAIEIIQQLTPILKVLPTKLHQVDLEEFVNLFSQALLRQHPFTPRVRALQVAAQAANGIFKLFNEIFIIQHDILFDENFETTIKQIGHLMSQFEEKAAQKLLENTINLNKDNLFAIFGVLATSKGLLKRPRVKKAFSDLENTIKNLFMGLKYEQKSQTYGDIFQEIKDYKSNFKQTFNSIGILFSDKEWFKEAQQITRNLENSKELDQHINKLTQEAETEILKYLSEFKPTPIFFFDQHTGKAVATFSAQIQKVFDIVVAFQQNGVKLNLQGKENQIKYIFSSLSAVQIYSNIAGFYNTVNSQLQEYQLTILKPSILAFENEMKKAAGASIFNFEDTSIEKIKKGASYIDGIMKQFQARVDKLEDFRKKFIREIKILSSLNIDQQQLWINSISTLRAISNQLIETLPPEQATYAQNFSIAAVAQVISVKYVSYLQKQVSNIPILKLKTSNDFEFNFSEQQIKQIIIDHFDKCANIITPDYFIYPDDMLTQIKQLSIEILLTMHELAKVKAETVYSIINYFKQKYYGVLYLNSQKSDQLCAQYCQSPESCQLLFNLGSGNLISPQNDLYDQFPTIISVNENTHIYKFDNFELDLSILMNNLNDLPMAYQTVAVSSASYTSQQTAQKLIDEVSQFTLKMQSSLTSISSSAQLADLRDYFQKVKVRVLGELKNQNDDMLEFYQLIQMQSTQRDSVLKLIELSSYSFNILKEKIQGTESLIEDKKEEMKSTLQQQNSLIVDDCKNTKDILFNTLNKLSSIFMDLTKVSSDFKVDNKLFLLYHEDSQVSQLTTVFTEMQQTIASVTTQTQQMEQEMQLLFNQSYQKDLSAAQITVINQIIQLDIPITTMHQIILHVDKLIQLKTELFRFDWPTLKTRLDLLEEISSDSILLKEHLSGFKNQLDSTGLNIDEINQFCTHLSQYLTFTQSFSQTIIQNLKLLKSPVLTKQHWLEIVESSQMLPFIKFYAQNNQFSSQLPDSIIGAAFCHFFAALTLNQANQQFGSSQKYETFVKNTREIIVRAENEQSIRGAVDEVQFWLQSEAKVQFTLIKISPFSQSELSEIGEISLLPSTGQWKPILTALTEKKSVLASVSSSPYSKFLMASIEDSNCAIEAVTQFALLQGQIGRQITVLEPVIARKVLMNETRRFYAALKVVGFVFQEQEQNALVAQLIRQQVSENFSLPVVNAFEELGCYKFVIQQLESASLQLAQVQTALRVFLEGKRLIFPRFYFLADSDVLEILSGAGSNSQIINSHIKKMFSAIEKLQINEDKIVSFTSPEGETVQLRKQVVIDNNPENWLGLLDSEIKQTLKQEFLKCLQVEQLVKTPEGICNQYSEIKKITPYVMKNDVFFCIREIQNSIKANLDIQNVSGEMLCVAFSVMFTAQVDYAIFGQKDENKLLEQTKTRMQTFLKAFTDKLYSPQLSSATFGSQDYVLSLKLKQLATDTTHFIAVLDSLLEDSASRAWVWNRELKYRVYQNTGDLFIVSLDTFLPYTFEYQGLPPRLIHTPLTDRCYSTLTSALNISKSSNPQGPAGTGKTETVKAFCAKLARPCIVFNCDSAIDRENLSRILIGIVLSGSVGCFDEVNRLSPAVLSAVSADIEDVQKTILNRSQNVNLDDLFKLSDISVPVSKISPFSAVFVTMNPASREYRGRSELPFSLIKLLRPCFMGKADTSQIMETILSTSGFQFAKIWALKVDLTYSLASRRIPKQVHLDWGLRSLQAVLRQAALQRASLKPSNDILLQEKQVIIKSLSDATFSRVQGISKTIFGEILRDIFGENNQKMNKFGASSEIEERIAEKLSCNDREGELVIQLFRALTAKTGVGLLGKSASGKTRIRQKMRDAIYDVSNGFIEIREFLISPKSMSRSELLGYVDSSTKEWVDGALTRAARQAVSLLNAKQKPYIWPLIVFDGEIDPGWIEALNSSLDDNRLLSLSSGERIRFPMSLNPLEAYFSNASIKRANGAELGTNLRMDYQIPTPVSFLFETDSVTHASPATISRLAIILVSDPDFPEQIETIKSINQDIPNIVKILPQNLMCQLPKITTHLNAAGTGELVLKGQFSHGAVRILSSFGTFSEADLVKFVEVLGGSKADIGVVLSPICVQNNNQVKQQVWAQKVIQSYFANGTSIVLSGGNQSGKYYSLQNAILGSNYDLLEIACTQLTGRTDIIRSLTHSCVEFQRSNGERVIKPKGGNKLVVLIRDADVVECDEYGHSEIYSLLWSIVAHNKVYLKNGQDCILQDIIVNISVTNYNSVPDRIQRLIGLVQFQELTETDNSIILQSFYEQYKAIQAQTNLKLWLGQAVEEAEAQVIRAKQQNQNYIIALPKLLPQFRSPQLSQLIKIKDMNLNSQQIITVMEYLMACPIPYKSGRTMANKDLQCLGKKEQDQYLTYYKQNLVQSVSKSFSLDEPIKTTNEFSFVGSSKKLSQIKELVEVCQDYYPCLSNYEQILEKLPQQSVQDLLSNIAALEFAFIQTKGAIVFTLPNNLSIESIYVALITTGHDIRFIGSDYISNQAIKSISERIANGFTKLAVIIDSAAVETDSQWTQFVSAIAAKDIGFLRNKLNLADLRSLISIFQEKHHITDELSEEQFIIKLLTCIINSIIPVLVLNPERKLTNTILESSPPLRRSYNIVSYEISENQTLPSFILAQFQSIQSNYQLEIQSEFHQEFQKFIKNFTPQNVILSNNQYIRAFIIYNKFYSLWNAQISTRRDQLQSGLKQLEFAQQEVDKLSQEAQNRQKAVENAQNSANQALADITQKMVIVQENKRLADQMQTELSTKEVVITQQKIDSEAELSTVMPILEEATKAVSGIPNDAISEVKSFKNPPPAVAIVLEAVLTFMGQADMSWQGMRAFLSQSGVLRQIASLDIKKVPSAQLKKVIVLTQKQPDAFVQEKIQKVSRAAAPLAKWVSASLQYASVYVKIEPLIKAASEASEALSSLKTNLERTQTSIQLLEDETRILRDNFDQKTQDLVRFQAELAGIEVKKERGNTMLNQLKDERIRWALNQNEAQKQLEGIHSACIRCASMFVLAGNRTDDIRGEFCGVENREFFQKLLIDVIFKDNAKNKGLRDSNSAMENAKLIHELKAQNGLFGFVLSNVTDATGALTWLQKEISCQQISATSENLSNLLAIAARFGQQIIVTDCDSGVLPSALIAYLRYGSECYKRSENSNCEPNQEQLNFGNLIPQTTLLVPSTSAKMSELHQNFKIFAVSSVQIQLPSDLQGKLLEVSFAPTEKSRSDYYVDQVLLKWSPESLNQMTKLNETEAQLRFNLANIECTLLKALQESDQVNILEDENLMKVLENATKQSIEVKQTQEQAYAINLELKVKREKAMLIAEVVSKSIQALEQINQLNELYVVDDSTVVPILNDILGENLSPNFDQKVIQRVNQLYLFQLYLRLNNMVFSNDRIGAISILLKFTTTSFTQNLYNFFTGRCDGQLQQNIPSWAKKNSHIYSQLCLSLTNPMSLNFENEIWTQFAQDIQNWKDINISKLPQTAISLNIIEKLAIITFFRPDLLSQSLNLACELVFTVKNSQIQDPVQQAIRLVNGIYQPIIIYTASGQDPTNQLKAKTVAISPGKEKECEDQLFNILDGAGKSLEKNIQTLIVVKGAHLCLNWLNSLSSKLVQYATTFSAKYDPKYPQFVKIILLLEPKQGFPKNLSRISWRIHLQAQSSPKDTFLSLIYQWPIININNKLGMQFYSILYVLTSFHAILEGRIQYAPRGVGSDPGWNSQDLLSLAEILIKSVQFDNKIDIVIERAQGLIIDAVYGASTKDEADLNLIKSMVKIIFDHNIIASINEKDAESIQDIKGVEESYKTVPQVAKLISKYSFLKYILPPVGIIYRAKSVQAEIIKYVSVNFPQNPSPDSLALPSNALLTKGEKDSLLVKSILQRAGNVGKEGENTSFYQTSQKINTQFLMVFQKLNQLKVTASKSPISEELNQQFENLLFQMKIIKTDLEGLIFSSQNPLLASSKSRQIALFLNSGITPEHWANGILAPPTPVAPLDQANLVTISTGGPQDFITFLEQSGLSIQASLASLPQKIEIELNLLPRPTAIMEAIRRHFGVETGQELDKISLKAVIGGNSGVFLKNGSLSIQGGTLVGQGINLSQKEGFMNGISIQEGKCKAGIPVYVDKQREIRLPVTDLIGVEADLDELNISGVYVHLTGR